MCVCLLVDGNHEGVNSNQNKEVVKRAYTWVIEVSVPKTQLGCTGNGLQNEQPTTPTEGGPYPQSYCIVSWESALALPLKVGLTVSFTAL